MRKEYQQELKELKAKMLKAEKFAEKLPIFADRILEHKFTGEETGINFGSYYKKLYLAWGIKRYFYKDNKNITNCKIDVCDKYLFCIYINTLSLYDQNEDFGLFESLKDVDIFFIDHLNSTFYVTDENIEHLLEALNTWCLVAREEAQSFKKAERIKKARQELIDLGAA